MPTKKKQKKKKQRPQKRRKEEPDNVSLDKTSQAFRSNRLAFKTFLAEMIQWLLDRQQQVDELLSHRDADRSGSVNLKDFEQGLMNLDVPCQQYQLHTLTQLLKNANNTISYRDLSSQVQRLSDGTEMNTQVEDVSRLEQFTPRRLLNPKQDRFIHLSVRMIPFDLATAHPGNFEVVLLSSSRVFSLIRIIQDRVGIQTCRLEVFRSRVPTKEACLHPENSLEECGFKGGPEDTPPEDTVYYDYGPLFTDCPILNCDHYFRSTSDSAAMRRNHCP
uniref:uncharacterized protein LOC124072873 isoform X2 n=1 Tax=Scatophagus argus TaxID=75038 RepID=UPI001ED7EAA8|nr:uncharacterized protein LOC124072873 isoform X2 [Scatophagus argus]